MITLCSDAGAVVNISNRHPQVGDENAQRAAVDGDRLQCPFEGGVALQSCMQ